MSETIGSQTSSYPDGFPTLEAQSEVRDGAPDPTRAQAYEFNRVLAELLATMKSLGLGRGLVSVVGTTATAKPFIATDGASVISFAGDTVAMSGGAVPHYIYFSLLTTTLVASTVGFPATKHVPLAIWPGTGTDVTDKRPQLPAAIASAPLTHASTHISAGADEIDGDKLDVDYAPPGYTPSAAGSPGGATTSAHLAAHLQGISDSLLSIVGGVPGPKASVDHDATHIRGGSDQIDGDLIDIDATPSGYTPSTAGAPGGAKPSEHLAAHLKGIGDALGTKAATSHSHAASDVTIGTFADARVAATNVTQHQTALSIAATQLTGDIAIARLAAALLLSAKGDILGHSGSAFAKLAAGTNGYLLTADSGETSGLKWAASGLGAVQIQAIALYQDQKTQNTAGGSLTSGAWRTRDLNTEVSDAQGIGTLASSQVTLGAGTYITYVQVPFYNCLRSQAKIYNATDASDIALSSSDYSATTVSGRNVIYAKFTLAGSKAIEVQHQGQADSGIRGFGVEANFTTEVYTQLLIIKVSA